MDASYATVGAQHTADMSNPRYVMSFTAGSLFLRESVRLAELFLELDNWTAVRERVLGENLLQTRTRAAAQRQCREICARLQTLEGDEAALLVHGTAQDQVHLLWIAVCRRYRFIADFAAEVIRERFLALRFDLDYPDFDHFFDGKAAMHPELDSITPSTRNKLRQVLFRMLREATLLGRDHALQPVHLSSRLKSVLGSELASALLLFPTLEAPNAGSTL